MNINLKQLYIAPLFIPMISLVQPTWAEEDPYQQQVETDIINYLNSNSLSNSDLGIGAVDLGVANLGQILIENAGFETGNTTGWDIYIPQGGIGQVVNSHDTACFPFNTESPFDGDYFLELKTDGPGSYTTAAQFLVLGSGDTLYGAAIFDSDDAFPFIDNANVRIYLLKPNGFKLVAEPWEREANNCGTVESWTTWSWTASKAGLYALTYRVTNAEDSEVDSYALFDSAVCTKTQQLLCDPAFLGTNGADIILGSPGVDIICSRGGDDEIIGLGGDDLLCGGPGKDEIYGGEGQDILYGGDDEDELYGGKGDDLLYGGDKTTPDMLYGGTGNDTCIAERYSKKRECEIKITEKEFLNN